MLSGDTLARLKANTSRVKTRAIFERPEFLSRLDSAQEPAPATSALDEQSETGGPAIAFGQ